MFWRGGVLRLIFPERRYCVPFREGGFLPFLTIMWNGHSLGVSGFSPVPNATKRKYDSITWFYLACYHFWISVYQFPFLMMMWIRSMNPSPFAFVYVSLAKPLCLFVIPTFHVIGFIFTQISQVWNICYFSARLSSALYYVTNWCALFRGIFHLIVVSEFVFLGQGIIGVTEPCLISPPIWSFPLF